MEIHSLQKFALPGQLEIVSGAGGLPFIRISNAAASAEICLLGAHVTSYIPNGQKDLLWMSRNAEYIEGKSLRGGVPICWPWFGAPPAGADTSHGYVRFIFWELTATRALSPDCTEAVFSMFPSPAAPKAWQESFVLTYTVRVGASLELELCTSNTGSTAFQISQAFHTYYNISDIEKIQINGFSGLPYHDTVVGSPEPHKVQQGPITFAAETDAVFEQNTGTAEILDPGFQRIIRISKQNSSSAVVWNPWINKAKKLNMADEEYRTMVCVENCNIRSDAQIIQPGKSFTLKAKITAVPKSFA
ncbi:MAG: D-hexose-6-phosphate mutarotase [Lentisphaerae bacterium]|jgi:D-hexose-6-phosphate mutarotase|nr:D-hexose-6-phosphate mutarotase [Lentisphaerota bacterium]